MKKSSLNRSVLPKMDSSWTSVQKLAAIVCRLDGVGAFQSWGRFVSRGQGTIGSIFALPFWAFIQGYFSSFFVYGLVLLGMILVGWFAVRIYERKIADADRPEVVIDEFVGMGVAMIVTGNSWILWITAFLFFRLFDIWKPPGVRFFDRRYIWGWGVILDDLVAGFYAWCVVQMVKSILTGAL